MRGTMSKCKRIRKLILAALLTAALVSSGASAFAAGIDQTVKTVPLQRYQTGSEGFSPTGEPEIIRIEVDDAGTVCYSLTDLARATGNDPDRWRWGFSTIFFHGSMEEPRYDIPAYHMVVDGRNCEYQNGRIVISGRCLSYPDNVAFLERDGEAYCSASGVEALFSNAAVTDGEIRVLAPGQGAGIPVITRSRLAQEYEDAFTGALWSLFNDCPEGCQLVMKRAARFRIVRRSAALDAHISAYVIPGSRTIRFMKESLGRTSNEYLAAQLVHECTHLEEYATTGSTSETAPTLATAQTLYALGISASEIRDQLSSYPRRYAQGVAQALEWLDTVADGLAR